MQTIRYSRIRLGIMAALSALFFWAGVWMAINLQGKGAFAGVLCASVMVFALAFAVRYLVDNTIARIGASSLDFHGLLGTRRIRYDRIIAIDIETTSVNFVKQRHLAIKCADHTLGKSRIAEKLLERRTGKLEGVLDLIANGPEAASPVAIPARPATHTPAGAAPIAQTAAPNPAAQRVRGFGRKSV
ncbi:hypothetical protein [Erythrobacter sp.]|jgi:hypothetical protein|uniref:hypothetical protein n=1 Tax=Erythrobacter sp. TaxID=1042 RepID=UPI002ECD2C49|nr:hypothetical protein [Erythrobacter sp.]